MSRTDKQGIARSKQLQQKSSKLKCVNKQPIYIAIRKKTLEKALEDGDVYAKENIKGRIYHWYRLGRKSCYETGLKIDPDGYDRWGLIRYKLLKRLNK